MALEQKLSLRLSQRLVMTPSLQQAIKLLQMTRLELEGVLSQELEENPVLESTDEDPEEGEEIESSPEAQETSAESEGSEAAEAAESTEEADRSMDEIDLDAYFNDYLESGDYRSSQTYEAREAVPLENTLTREPDLYDHLLWQLHMLDLAPLQREIAELIIGNLDQDGFLVATVEEIMLLAATPEQLESYRRAQALAAEKLSEETELPEEAGSGDPPGTPADESSSLPAPSMPASQPVYPGAGVSGSQPLEPEEETTRSVNPPALPYLRSEEPESKAPSFGSRSGDPLTPGSSLASTTGFPTTGSSSSGATLRSTTTRSSRPENSTLALRVSSSKETSGPSSEGQSSGGLVERSKSSAAEAPPQEHVEAAEPPGYPREKVEAALEVVRSFDPAGIAWPDLRESLLHQLRANGKDESLTYRLIDEEWPRVLRRQFPAIAKSFGVPLADLEEPAGAIRALETRPGRRFGGTGAQYVEPDVVVVKVGEGYAIQLNDDGMPRLRVSKAYRRMLQKLRAEGQQSEAQRFIKEKMRSAMWLIKSLDQRQRTIYKVADSIVKQQRGFLERGIEHLRPMVLRNVADDIGMHESTVSRVVSNKYIHTPRGLYPMKFFFHSGIDRDYGEEISSLTVKRKIQKLIEGEDDRKPLSDSELMRRLNRQGIKIARRTVAKYRDELNIPSSTDRKRVF